MLPISRKWHDIYHLNLLKAFLAEDFELINNTFVLDEPLSNMVNSETRGFRLEFSELMFDWIMSGQTEISEEMLALNPNAAKFATVYHYLPIGNITTAYGPRIKSQWEYAKEELQRDPESRRACIMMLAAQDLFVAKAIEAGKTKCEYICTYGFNFRIRKGVLDMHVSMRSNNYTTTVCQDVYVFTKIQEVMAIELNLPVGKYYHHAVSGHIIKHEIKRACEILQEYVDNFPVDIKGDCIWQEETFKTAFHTRFFDLEEQRIL